MKTNVYSNEVLIADLLKVARFVGSGSVSRGEYKLLGRFAVGTFANRFGSWNKAVDAAGLLRNELFRWIVDMRYKRKGISVGLRLRVLTRDRFRCKFCGASPANDVGVSLHIDHIVPVARGGRTELANLQTLCAQCNLMKGAWR